MKRDFAPRLVAVKMTAGLLIVFLGMPSGILSAKEKPTPPVDPNDVTVRLFQLLDETRDGKLKDFYVLADIIKDPTNPDQELQHVLLVDYDKNRIFGKLNLHVRSLGKMLPEQLKAYTAKQIFDYGADDTEKFVKSEPGSFGRTGDLYLRATADLPLVSTPITEETRKHYEFYLAQYVLPALQKK